MDSSIHCRKAAALFDVAHMCGASFRVGNAYTVCEPSTVSLLYSPARPSPTSCGLTKWLAATPEPSLILQGKDAISFLETLIVGDIASLEDRTGTLSVFTNEKGGIIDDSVITKARTGEQNCHGVHAHASPRSDKASPWPHHLFCLRVRVYQTASIE